MKNVTVIAGTSRGLGKELALHFLNQNHTVYGCSRSASSIVHACYFHKQIDLKEEVAVRAWFSEIGEANKVDHFIYNAAVGFYNHVLLSPISEIENNVRVNFLTAVLCAQEVARIKNESNLNILFLSSVLTQQKVAGHLPYVFSKLMIENLTVSLAAELAPLNIRVNAVAPGAMASGLGLKIPTELVDQSIKNQPIHKLTEIEDVIHVIDFLTNEKSRLVTGQVIRLGGVH